VQELEATLRNAVAAQRKAESGKARESKTVAVHKLATRLLAARLRVLLSRIADLEPQGIDVTGLREAVADTQAGGVTAILSEFDAIES